MYVERDIVNPYSTSSHKPTTSSCTKANLSVRTIIFICILLVSGLSYYIHHKHALETQNKEVSPRLRTGGMRQKAAAAVEETTENVFIPEVEKDQDPVVVQPKKVKPEPIEEKPIAEKPKVEKTTHPKPQNPKTPKPHKL